MAGATESMTVYQYAGNNPAMLNDPMGDLADAFINRLINATKGNGADFKNIGGTFFGTDGSVFDGSGNDDNRGYDIYLSANGDVDHASLSESGNTTFYGLSEQKAANGHYTVTGQLTNETARLRMGSYVSQALQLRSDRIKLANTQDLADPIIQGGLLLTGAGETLELANFIITGIKGLVSLSEDVAVSQATRIAATDFAKELPSQIHHFATNKSSTFTPLMQEIVEEFGLNLDDAWNKGALPHLGRHPNAYHEFVYEQMLQASSQANGNVNVFLDLFEQNVKQPVMSNPGLLRKVGW